MASRGPARATDRRRDTLDGRTYPTEAGSHGSYLRGTNGQLWGRLRGGVESKYLLPGFARCGVCGGGLYVKSRSHGTRRAYLYGCTSYHKPGATICPNAEELPMSRADDAVLSAVLGGLPRP